MSGQADPETCLAEPSSTCENNGGCGRSREDPQVIRCMASTAASGCHLGYMRCRPLGRITPSELPTLRTLSLVVIVAPRDG